MSIWLCGIVEELMSGNEFAVPRCGAARKRAGFRASGSVTRLVHRQHQVGITTSPCLQSSQVTFENQSQDSREWLAISLFAPLLHHPRMVCRHDFRANNGVHDQHSGITLHKGKPNSWAPVYANIRLKVYNILRRCRLRTCLLLTRVSSLS